MNHKPDYRFEPDGSFTLTHYNCATPFSSFLPGIAGRWGIPMWVFYVNRGQGVCSFGLRDKDHPIAEFLPANWAYQLVYRQGFQTFLKVRTDGAVRNYEPFQMATAHSDTCTQVMRVNAEEVGFQEINRESGLRVESRYFALPGEPLAALVRSLTIRNDSDRPMSIQMLDGLSVIMPHGLNHWTIKDMRYIAQSHVGVTGLAERIPGFRTKATTADSALVEEIQAVNFCFGYETDAPNELLMPIVDPRAVYDGSTDLSFPSAFLLPDRFHVPARQMVENMLPSALLFAEYTLAPGQERTFHSFYGHASNPAALADFALRARAGGYVEEKRRENRLLTRRLMQSCATVSSHEVFDAYARQNVLDNILRGGTPVTLSRGRRTVSLSLFARKHGDLERDYNYFVVEPTFFSQGESNYRDVNQNRRHDVFFNPDVGADSIVSFLNLIQADGFNPLLVRPHKHACRDSDRLRGFLAAAVGPRKADALAGLVLQEFELGGLLTSLSDKGFALKMPRDEFVAELMQFAEPVEDSAHGHGYWTDHWTYNLDLIDAYRGIFPERMQDLLFGRSDFVYADSDVFVEPRSRKYVLKQNRPMQLNSLLHDPKKEALIASRRERKRAMRTRGGRGPVYYTRLAPRLLALAAVKLASLDPHGVGIEMEADRPNWYDALNGLPGLFGSSSCETFELKRLLLLLEESLGQAPEGFAWRMPEEPARLIRGLLPLLRKPGKGSPAARRFAFWNRASELKEAFRLSIRPGFSGKEVTLSAKDVREFVALALGKVEDGLRRARDRKTGLVHTYFRHEVTRYTRGPEVNGHATLKPLAFRQIPLALFLEGQVHALRLETDIARAGRLARAVKQSGLFDQTLNMYKVNACLDREPFGIGRCRTFARGWLENESIWLHMEYKYLLELLRRGLFLEFFEDFRHCAVPFLKPEQYGRSTTENSSFIVSEAYPDKSSVGKGYMARLSGATAEFVHMWLLLCAGEYPFRLDDQGRLEARLSPALPSWLFTTRPSKLETVGEDGQASSVNVTAGGFAFVFLRHTTVVYAQRGSPRDTFGPRGARIQGLRLTYNDGTRADVAGDVLAEPHASALRDRRIRLIEADLA